MNMFPTISKERPGLIKRDTFGQVLDTSWECWYSTGVSDIHTTFLVVFVLLIRNVYWRFSLNCLLFYIKFCLGVMLNLFSVLNSENLKRKNNACWTFHRKWSPMYVYLSPHVIFYSAKFSLNVLELGTSL